MYKFNMTFGENPQINFSWLSGHLAGRVDVKQQVSGL